MTGWIALGLLAAAMLLGGYMAVSFYAYHYGININLKVAFVLGGALLAALALFRVMRQKKPR